MDHKNDLDKVIAPKKADVSYSSYLKIEDLLNLQKPLSTPQVHDEMLFVIIHQVYELWFKQIHHEINHGISLLDKNELLGFVRGLNRIAVIQDVLIKQVDVLETMTPTEFNAFRDRLNPASGFQSYQFRLMEFTLGAKNKAYMKFYEAFTQEHKELEQAMQSPTVYDHVLGCLNRLGYKIPDEVLNRDVKEIYEGNQTVVELLSNIYSNPSKNYDIYMLCEALINFDEKFLLWRFRHVAMVERMIGNKMGTGGSSGVSYLSSTLKKKFFPDIWQVRNTMHSSDSSAY